MPITDAQIEVRSHPRDWIGGSEAAAILGCDPWTNAADIYWRMVAGVEPHSGEGADAGNVVEPGLVEWARNLHGDVEPNNSPCWTHARPYLRSTPDGRKARWYPGDGKTSGLESGRIDKGWLDGDGGVVLPDRVICQMNVAMYCTEYLGQAPADHSYVWALLVGQSPLIREIVCPWDERVARVILQAIDRFWNEHYVPRRVPDVRPHYDTLKHMRRKPEVVQADHAKSARIAELWAELASRREEARYTNLIARAHAAAIISEMGDAEGVQLTDGTLLTFRKQHRREYRVKETSYPVLRRYGGSIDERYREHPVGEWFEDEGEDSTAGGPQGPQLR